MKKGFVIIVLCLTLLLASCSGTPAAPGASATPTPTPTPLAAGAPSQPQPSAGSTPSAAPSQSQSSLYDPSIFIIEISGEWQQELAPEYYANNECEIYLHKIDANDNRQVAGSYQGICWMKTTLDTSGYISEMLKDVPFDLSFDAGGEAVCDNLGISLNTTDDKAWTNYNISDDNGNPLPLTQDTPVGKGSFVTVTKSVYLEAHGQGAQGEKVDYSDASSGDLTDINYVIHVAPDSMESNGERKVVISLSGEGFSVTLDGTMRRIPGYPEDVSDYLNSQDYQNSAWKHLQE
jgi:hypothetical protein